MRGINSNDPRAVRCYHAALEKFLDASQIEKCLDLKLKQIEERNKSQRPELLKQLDQLDALLTSGRLQAEQACRKMSKVPWSPKLMETQRKVRFWRMRLAEKRYGKNFAVHSAQASVGARDNCQGLQHAFYCTYQGGTGFSKKGPFGSYSESEDCGRWRNVLTVRLGSVKIDRW
jgi:hypothetical protein